MTSRRRNNQKYSFDFLKYFIFQFRCISMYRESRKHKFQFFIFLNLLFSLIFTELKKNAIISKENVDDDDIYTTHIFLLFFDIFNFFSSFKFSLKNLITICDTWKIHHIMEQRPDTSRPFSSIGYSSNVRCFFCSFSIPGLRLY